MADCSFWQSQVSDRSKGYFEAVTVMNSGSPECQGGYPMPKTTPKRCVSTVKSQPEPRLALKRRESRVYKTWLSLNPLRGCFLNIEAESRNGAKQELRSPRQTKPDGEVPKGWRVVAPTGRTIQRVTESPATQNAVSSICSS